MKISPAILAAAAAGIYFLTRQGGGKNRSSQATQNRSSQGGKNRSSQSGEIVELAKEMAAKHGVPPHILLATGQVESNLKHLAPRGTGMGKTHYPYGIQTNRGMDILGRMYGQSIPPDEVSRRLQDLAINTEAAAMELARGWKRYPDEDRIRVWWVLPAAARKGPPYSGYSGSVPWEKRLKRWREAVAKWKPRVS